MYTFSDESGRFEESVNSDIGIFVIVSITDTALANYEKFIKENFGEKASFLKGKDLSLDERQRIIKYIGKYPEIRVSAFVYDHKATSITAISEHQKKQILKANEALERLRPIAKYPTLVPSIELARNQLKKLSIAEYLKVVLHTIAFQSWERYFLYDFQHVPRQRDSWGFKHILDTQNQPNTFPRLVYFLLQGSQNQLAPEPPTMYWPEQWGSSHPFFDIYKVDDENITDEDKQAIDLRKFYIELRCGDDKTDLGLKIPDIIANTLFRSITHPEDASLLKLLKKMWGNRSAVHRIKRSREYYQVIIFPSDEVKPYASNAIQRHWNNLSKILPKNDF